MHCFVPATVYVSIVCLGNAFCIFTVKCNATMTNEVCADIFISATFNIFHLVGAFFSLSSLSIWNERKKTALDSTTISNIFAALGMFAFDFAAAQSTRIVRCDLLARLKYFVIYEFLLFKINGIPCILCIALFFLAVTEKTVWITFFLAFYERAFCLMHWINIFFAQQKKSRMPLIQIELTRTRKKNARMIPSRKKLGI